MKKITYIISTVLLLTLLVATVPYMIKVVGVVFFPPKTSVLKQLSLYQWAFVGIGIFAIIHRIVKRNMVWLETFTHELTHIVVAMLLLRRVHSFHAEEGTGVVCTSGNNSYGLAPMALAPYCLPIFTYLFLSIRCLMDFHGMWIYDTIIGMTISFHFFCIKNQIGNYQTDINQYPLLFSYLYIVTAWVINFCIIWVAFFPQYNVFTSIWRLVTNLFQTYSSVIGLLG